jgi:hypothetical protein
MSTNNNTTYVSKPPKFEGKQGSAYVVWSIKFQSWAGVKGVRATLNPSFEINQLQRTPYWMIRIPHRRPKERPSCKMLKL